MERGEAMKKMIMMIMMMVLNCPLSVVNAATGYVSSAMDHRSAIAWGTGGLPDTADVIWWLGDGVDYDTNSTGTFYNYGESDLAAGLSIVNAPGLTENISAPHNSACSFDGTNDMLQVNDAAALSPGAEDFGAFVWVRLPLGGAIDRLIFSNRLSGSSEWFIAVNSGTANFTVWLSDDGSDDAAHTKKYATTGTYQDGEWHLAGFTWVSDVLTIYVDGDEVTVTMVADAAISSIYSSATAKPTIGARSDGVGAFQGDIGWAAYWEGSHTPTGTEVTFLFDAMSPDGSSGDPYPSIQAAAYQQAAGDTILIETGTYRETVTISKAFDYIGGQLGSRTGGQMPELYGAALPSAAGTVGMTISAKTELGFLDVRGFTTAQGLLADGSSDGSLFHHLVIDSCLTAVNLNGACDNDSLVNCTLDGAGISSSTGVLKDGAAGTVVVENCLVVNCAVGLNKSTGTIGGGNNDFFANSADYSGMSALTGDMSFVPHFRGGNDYRLMPGDRLNELGILIHSGLSGFSGFGKPAAGAWDSRGMRLYPISRGRQRFVSPGAVR
jgi:hypothetical protein